MLYGAALYNNGVLPGKDPIVGESYAPDGTPRMLKTVPAAHRRGDARQGHPARCSFPSRAGSSASPATRSASSSAAAGAGSRSACRTRSRSRASPTRGSRRAAPARSTAPIPSSSARRRRGSLDPMLSFLGTNDHPGDFRSSGCTACHVVYANDRSTPNSGPYADVRQPRHSAAAADPTIPKDEPGHPLEARLHARDPVQPVHDLPHAPRHQHGRHLPRLHLVGQRGRRRRRMYPKAADEAARAARDGRASSARNPEGAALTRPLVATATSWPTSRASTPSSKNTQFADFHGHGWVFRAVFKQDRKGNLLDGEGKAVAAPTTPSKFRKAVHLKDIHLEKGMHCVDCHFKQDSHGNGKLYGEPRAAVEIDCVDCHGTIAEPATLVTTGPALRRGTDLSALSTPFGAAALRRAGGGKVTQRSMVTDGVEWEVPQVLDTITPGNPRYSEKVAAREDDPARRHDLGRRRRRRRRRSPTPTPRMTCYACHSAWTTSCFGCHLSMKANEKKPNAAQRGRREPQLDELQLPDAARRHLLPGQGRHGHRSNRIAPARSACAVARLLAEPEPRVDLLAAADGVLAAASRAQAFSTYVPAHGARPRRRSAAPTATSPRAGDNNAWMAQLLMQGTGPRELHRPLRLRRRGRARLRGGRGDRARRAAGGDRQPAPRARLPGRVPGARGRGAAAAARRPTTTAATCVSLQLRGEYLFAAQGTDGLRIYDVAQVDHKGFSRAHRLGPGLAARPAALRRRRRTPPSVALPTTHDDRSRRGRSRPENQEQPIHPLYDYAYVTDREEGLVVVGPLAHARSTATRATTSSRRAGDLQPRRRARPARPR